VFAGILPWQKRRGDRPPRVVLEDGL